MKQKDFLANVLSVLFSAAILFQMILTVLVWRDLQTLKGQLHPSLPPLSKNFSPFINGDHFPSFSFTDISERTRQIDEWRGDTLLVIFASHTCSACKKMYETLEDFLKQNQNLSIVIITSSSPEQNQEFLENYHLMDFDRLTVGNIAQTDWLALNIVVTPTLVLVQNNGVITNVWLGYSDTLWSEIKSTY